MSKDIKITKAEISGNTTNAYPPTSQDSRSLTKELDVTTRWYYTYILNEDKVIHDVIRRLPGATQTKNIQEELGEMDLNASEVSHLKRDQEELSC